MCKITQTVLACCQLLVGGRGIRFISLFEGPDWPLVGAQWDSGAPGWSGGNVKETRREPPSGFSLLNQQSSLVNQGNQPPSWCSVLRCLIRAVLQNTSHGFGLLGWMGKLSFPPKY